MNYLGSFFSLLLLALLPACSSFSEAPTEKTAARYLNISGIYPHLTAYNQPDDSSQYRNHRECGIGSLVPWAGKLWYLTYPPHMRTGSNDKLYMVEENFDLQIRPESIGGTHANRLIHRESNQLFMGPYVIDAAGKVRGVDVQQLEGRLTATTRHLNDPANMVYYYDMEGMLYEMEVHSLEVNRLFEKPVPGWHGKGAYVGQGRLVVANNGEHQGHSMAYAKLLVGGEANSQEEAGVLAEWDGKDWRIVERKQFTDVTGPGGIYGNAAESDPIWSMGWDKRSVILKLLDGGTWYTYRLPKASHTFDPRHGWFTEWPRIREIGEDRMMMVMHGTMFDFPKTFSRANSAGISPIATHLRYIPDFCMWNGQLVLAADDASSLQNPIVGQAQSNLWFGSVAELAHFGPRSGWGGVWVHDVIKAGEASDPFLVGDYEQRSLHLAHDADEPVRFQLEIDPAGRNEWQPYRSIEVPAHGYKFESLPGELSASWIRLHADQSCTATAYFHYASPRPDGPGEKARFAGLAEAGEAAVGGLIRPAGHNRSLQVLLPDQRYLEVVLNDSATDLTFFQPAESRAAEVEKRAAKAAPLFVVEESSVLLTQADGQRFRLPKGPATYDQPGPNGYPRALREVQSERYLANIHGMFYEVPRAEGAGNHVPDFEKMKPVSRHNKQISDYCSWRGLLVLAGVRPDAPEDGQVFSDGNGTGLWFGQVDDAWKFGKPSGLGGPWKNTPVQAEVASDPYLMTGFDQKSLRLSHDAGQAVQMNIEVAIAPGEWQVYRQVEVPAGESLLHEFPADFHAYWVRLRAAQACQATAMFTYE